jgi:hypothetical protein
LDNLDFGARLQSAGGLGFRAHALNRIHNVLLLRRRSFAKCRRPCKIFRKSVENAWELSERFYRRVPRLLIDCLGEGFAGEAGIIFHPKSCVDNLIRESGRAENLRNESIGIKSDRSDQRIKLVGSKRSVLLWCCLGGRGLRGVLRRGL